MQRSSSVSRTSDEFFINLSPAAMVSSSLKIAASNDLPIYNSVSDAGKKEIAPLRKSLAENAIHLIPVVLLLCGLILWIFSAQ